MAGCPLLMGRTGNLVGGHFDRFGGTADVTDNFLIGARQVLSIAQRQGIRTFLLKSRSPSCGVDGSPGVTAALLLQHGYDIEEF